MFLEKSKSPNKKGYYLRIREWVTVKGKWTKVTLKNIGFISSKDIDTINKWRDFVELFNEITEKSEKIKEQLADDTEDGDCNSINLGCCFIEQILAIYSIREILANYQKNNNFNYQLYLDTILAEKWRRRNWILFFLIKTFLVFGTRCFVKFSRNRLA